VPLVYTVDRVRDGRSFTTRRVTAIQHGKAIFTLSASFQRQEEGLEHATPMPAVPAPEELRSNAQRLQTSTGGPLPRHFRDDPIELRSVGPLTAELAADPSLRGSSHHENLVWVRVTEQLPDDPLLHVCLMTYVSDITLLETVALEHGLSFSQPNIAPASLDHAMWFHRPFRADRWLLYAQESPVASGARGLVRGQVFTAEGDLVVSVMQEGLIRIIGQLRD
jgi:acyl-CoA thioesterase-2